MRTRLAASIGVAALTFLAGCGSDLGPDIHPGSAAVVGDVDVSLDEVDDYANELCAWQEPQIKQAGVVLPMAFVKAVAMESIVEDLLTHQFAEEKRLEPAAFYKEAIASVKARVVAAKLPEKAAATMTEFETRDAYHQAVIVSAGHADLAAEGKTAEDAGAFERGQEVFAKWQDSVDVAIDPRFGTLETEGENVNYLPGDALSVRVSDLAKRAADGQADKEYVESLPPSQRCGGA